MGDLDYPELRDAVRRVCAGFGDADSETTLGIFGVPTPRELRKP